MSRAKYILVGVVVAVAALLQINNYDALLRRNGPFETAMDKQDAKAGAKLRNMNMAIEKLKDEAENAKSTAEETKAEAEAEANLRNMTRTIEKLKDEAGKVKIKTEETGSEEEAKAKLISTTPKVEAKRGEDFPGIIEIGGPLCSVEDRLIIPVVDEDHEIALRCKFEKGCATNYSFPTNVFSQAELLLRLPPEFYVKTLFWRQDSSAYSNSTLADDTNLKEYPPPPLINMANETGLLLNNAAGAHHFGHDMDMYIPLIIRLEAGEMDSVSHLVDLLFLNDHPRWKSLITDSLVKDVLLKTPLALERSNATPSFLLRSHNITCFANAAYTVTKERYFSKPRDVELFQNAIRRAYPYFKPNIHSCPPPKAIVLYRSGLGAGLRRILNYDMVEQALLDNGITSYSNVTVSQESSIEDALSVFSSAGLIISTHSSQLKLLAFAHPGTIVVEVRPTEASEWNGWSTMSEGPDILGVHYISDNKHNADKETCWQSMCEAKGYIYSDIFVNRTELASAIEQGLKKQSERCPIWK